jgi:hypothetical protein
VVVLLHGQMFCAQAMESGAISGAAQGGGVHHCANHDRGEAQHEIGTSDDVQHFGLPTGQVGGFLELKKKKWAGPGVGHLLCAREGGPLPPKAIHKTTSYMYNTAHISFKYG